MARALGDLIGAFLAGRLAGPSPRQAWALEVWRRVAGPAAAQATQSLRLGAKTLTVTITDPLLREDLRYRARELRDQLRAAGLEALQKVVIR